MCVCVWGGAYTTSTSTYIQGDTKKFSAQTILPNDQTSVFFFLLISLFGQAKNLSTHPHIYVCPPTYMCVCVETEKRNNTLIIEKSIF